MSVSGIQILPASRRITKLTTLLTRKCEAHPVSGDLLTFGKSSRAFHSERCFHPVSCAKNRSAADRCFSTQVFQNQPPSWLFVNRAVGGAYGAQVNLELDLDDRLSGNLLEKLKSEVKLREMSLPLDIDELVKDFREMRVYEKKKRALDAKRDNIFEEIKLLKEENTSDDKTLKIQNLQEELNKMKTDRVELKPFSDLEHKVMLTALKLPNDLHSSTPTEDDLIIREVKGKLDPPDTQSHVDIAKKFHLITFSNVGPKAYYLKAELALAEIELTKAACAFLQSHCYRLMAGPEFVRTPIMEGCGRNIHNTDEVLTMLSTSRDVIEPMNHLTGVVLPTFAAYVAKTCIGSSILPLNMFSCGRCYQNGDLPGLLGAVQSTQATLFSCVQKESLDSHFHQSVELVWNFLEPLGFPLRMVQICARDLGREERRRLEVHIYAPSLRQFIPVAHVSDLSDFVSRRLMVFHNHNHADFRSASLVHMISGSLVNITSLLALWVEYSNTSQELFSLCPLELNSVQSPSCASP
ncbi:hypothetical protein BsWGS_23878 [Bradybaena similaris]